MNSKEENEKQDAQVLKWMLGQVYRAEKRKRQLDERLARIAAERDAPIGGQGYDPMPRNGSCGTGAASILFKLAEIEDRIYAQKEEIDKTIVRVMDILDYLPINSVEREICDLRHIDMKKWAEIQDEIPMSRSQVHKTYQKAINMLLSFPRVMKMVEDSRDDYVEHIYKQGKRDIKSQGEDGTPE